jgi:hypothetical protein
MPVYSFSTGVKFPRSPFQDGAITGNTGDTSTGKSFYSAFGSSVPMAHFSSGTIVETSYYVVASFNLMWGLQPLPALFLLGFGLPLFGSLIH